jgi:hypothetical protein
MYVTLLRNQSLNSVDCWFRTLYRKNWPHFYPFHLQKCFYMNHPDHYNLFFSLLASKNYSADRDAFIKGADGYLVMYSIDVAQSFHEIWQYKDQVSGLRKDDAPVFPVVLAGNKSDLDLVREVMQKDAQDLAATWGSIPAIELSSKDHNSVEVMFHTMVREMRKFRKMSALQKRQRADQCSVM